MFDITGKVALVAGGAGYLGVPICMGLAKQGAAVLIADLDQQRASDAAMDIVSRVPGARARGIHLDVGDESSVRHAVSEAVNQFGGLHISVNLTYGAVGKRVEDLSPEECTAALHTQLTGALMLARESAAVISPGGSIIIFSSMYGQVAPDPCVYEAPMNPNPVEYGMGKAGVIQLVKYLAVHWGSRDIRVNGIAPGPFPNPMVQQTDPAFVARLAEKTPLGRIGRQDELAGATVFLASDEASYVTGEIIAVNGGWTAW